MQLESWDRYCCSRAYCFKFDLHFSHKMSIFALKSATISIPRAAMQRKPVSRLIVSSLRDAMGSGSSSSFSLVNLEACLSESQAPWDRSIDGGRGCEEGGIKRSGPITLSCYRVISYVCGNFFFFFPSFRSLGHLIFVCSSWRMSHRRFVVMGKFMFGIWR